jgi:hypothetical protein
MMKMGYSVFYNDPRYTLARGDLYLIGLNPGGSGDYDYMREDTENVEWWIRMEGALEHPFSSYVDEEWILGRGKGGSPHQFNVRRLLGHICKGEDINEVTRRSFATNLYFYRTPGGTELQKYPSELVDCWSYHERFLAIVKPKIIICNGNAEMFSAFSKMKEKVGQDKSIEREPINRIRSIKWFKADSNWSETSDVLVIGLPHLSRPHAGINDILKAVDSILEKTSSRL